MLNNVAADMPVARRPLPTSREERGRHIAKNGGIKQIGLRVRSAVAVRYGWRLPRRSVEETCTCPDWELRRQQCKHVHAVYTWIA